MKISFTNIENKTSLQGEENELAAIKNSILTKSTSTKINNVEAATYIQGEKNGLIFGGKEKNKTTLVSDALEQAQNTDMENLKDLRTVLSNTLSEEDYKKACEDGFDLSDLDSKDLVTIVDKIKAELVKSGKNIEGYTDDVSKEALEQACGSSVLAEALVREFNKNDVPVTKENIEDVACAWQLVNSMDTISAPTLGYMVENDLKPQVWDFYIAKNSGADVVNVPVDTRNMSTDFASILGDAKQEYKNSTNSLKEEAYGLSRETGGYFTRVVVQNDQVTDEDLKKILTNLDIEVNDENLASARLLTDTKAEISEENIESLNNLLQVEFPVSVETFASACAVSIAKGKSALKADLTTTSGIYEKALNSYLFYNDDSNFETLEGLEKRVTLEKVRLKMTVETNIVLIQSGFSIDTEPIENTLKALEDAVKSLGDKYFPDENDSAEKLELFNKTTDCVANIKSLPIDTLSQFSGTDTLTDFLEKGIRVRDNYETAQKSYETFKTEPRADLGDSFKKAFENVDDILEDMDLPKNEANRRVIRVLGYNGMEINQKNFEEISQADDKFNRVINSMTPKATLKMIRDKVNPLTKDFDELEQYFNQQEEDYDSESKSYSKFLYNLEKDGNLTKEEKESYIGIYRLLNQIQKGDYAAIGATVNAQETLSFSSLLRAVRSEKNRNIDFRLGEAVGALKSLVKSGKAIDEQIMEAYSYTNDTTDYEREELEGLREAGKVEEAIARFLDTEEIDMTANNLLATKELFYGEAKQGKKNVFKKIKEASNKDTLNLLDENKVEDLIDSLNDGGDAFQKNYDLFIDNLDEQVQDLTLNDAETYLDVTALSMCHKMLGISKNLSQDDTFVLPMYIDNELTKVNVSFVKDDFNKGSININVKLKDGSGEGNINVNDGKISGVLAGDSDFAVNKLKAAADIFSTNIKEQEEYKEVNMTVVKTSEDALFNNILPVRNTEVSQGNSEVENKELYRIARAFLSALEK